MMRKLLLPAMLVLLTVSLSLVVGAQEKMRDKKLVPPLRDKAGADVVKGKVTEANPTAKTATISGQDGGKITLNFANAKAGACKLTPNVAGRLAPPRAPDKSAQAAFPKVGDNAVARANACDECLETC